MQFISQKNHPNIEKDSKNQKQRETETGQRPRETDRDESTDKKIPIVFEHILKGTQPHSNPNSKIIPNLT